jgi:hypothetical protein
MESREYFVRRAWDCYRLAGRSTDHGIAKMMLDAEHTFVVRAIAVGVPPDALPPTEPSQDAQSPESIRLP